MKIKLLFLLAIAFVTVFFVQCKENDPSPDSKFDKAGMLRNIGENVIIPAYSDLKISVDSLHYISNLFIASTSPENLLHLQQAFQKAYLNFQSVSVFEFGPADLELIRPNFNTFPCDTSEINSKIQAGNFTLSTIADLDVKGFPGLDYLLFGSSHNNQVVISKFTTDVNAEKRKSYLTALIKELKNKADIVNSAWSPTGGNYITTFKNNTGTDVGSSLGLLVNQLNFDYETLKNFKIGIPLGKKSLGTTFPSKVEAFYSQSSIELAKQHLKAIENLYLGRSKQGSDGLGLDDYLLHNQSQYNGSSLSDAIKSQLSKAYSKLNLIPDPLSETIINNPGVVDSAYNELQKLVVFFKTDMPSALGVLITYQDNDGD